MPHYRTMLGGGRHFRLINICLAIHAFVAPTAALAQGPLVDRIFQYYQGLASFEVDFTQSKTLRAEGITLDSRGALRVALGRALLYEIKAPGRLAVFLDDQALEVRSGVGAKATRSRYLLKGGEYSEKIAENLKELTALLAMNRAQLDQAYKVSEEPGRLLLVPAVPKQFVKVVMTVEAGASPWIKRIEIEEKSGDQMALEFEAPRKSDARWIEAWQKSG